MSLLTKGIQQSNAQSCAAQFPSEPLCKYCRVMINTRDITQHLLRFLNILQLQCVSFHTLRVFIQTKNSNQYFILVAKYITVMNRQENTTVCL